MEDINRIPGTKPEWNRNLPDRYSNSLVDRNGENYDNGNNFDEKIDDDTDSSNFQSLTKLDSFEKHMEDLNAKNTEPTDTQDELTPEQLEWREGHTQEEIDVLADKWDEWATTTLGYHHGKILGEMFEDKNLDWKFSDFETFFKNEDEVHFNTMGDWEGHGITGRLSDSLDILKNALGDDSPEYNAAARKIFIDIHDGKYQGARLAYNSYGKNAEIIFSDQKDAIEHDNRKREEAKADEEKQEKERQKKEDEKWQKSWLNPDNKQAFHEMTSKLDERTVGYLNKIMHNAGEISPDLYDVLYDKVNQGILDGANYYLDNHGYLHTGKFSEEYKGYDQKKPDDNNPPAPVSPIRKASEKTPPSPDALGDWNKW